MLPLYLPNLPPLCLQCLEQPCARSELHDTYHYPRERAQVVIGGLLQKQFGGLAVTGIPIEPG